MWKKISSDIRPYKKHVKIIEDPNCILDQLRTFGSSRQHDTTF